MATVGDYCTKTGYISRKEAEYNISKIDEALGKISTPDNSITIFGVLASCFSNPVVALIGFATSIYSLGALTVSSDLKAQRNVYNSVREMYIGSSSIINVEVKQKYVYRLCQQTYGWYVYGAPKITGYQTSSGWTRLS